jgi:SH3-like domain-containing protein
MPIAAAQAGSDAVTSGLPIPRFVSLKVDRVNVRGGPDKDHDVNFIVYHSLLSGKRMAAVQLKSKTDLVPLHAKPDAQSPVTAQLQFGVLGAVKRCTGTWCLLVAEDFDGWIEQNQLWGVYPDEKIE